MWSGHTYRNISSISDLPIVCQNKWTNDTWKKWTLKQRATKFFLSSSHRSHPRHHKNIHIVTKSVLNTEKNWLRIFLHNCSRDPENHDNWDLSSTWRNRKSHMPESIFRTPCLMEVRKVNKMQHEDTSYMSAIWHCFYSSVSLKGCIMIMIVYICVCNNAFSVYKNINNMIPITTIMLKNIVHISV